LHLGAAYTDLVTHNGNISGFTTVTAFISFFERRLVESPFSFIMNGYVVRAILLGCVAWVLGFSYYFTTRRKYISGKEHGTAQWATRNELSDLTAANIMKEEIKQAKKVSTPIGRFFEKRET